MLPIYKRGQLSKPLVFWGVFAFVIFCIFLTTGKFEMRSGSIHGRHQILRVISREDNPLIYWGTESVILVVAVLLVASGVYRARKDSDDDDT
jgi:hypothetical protein